MKDLVIEGGHAPNSEQSAILEAALDMPDNLQLVARAGAAKTTTLRLIAEVLPKERILCAAFNKAIADEMKEVMPPNVTALTLNSIGFRALGRFFPRLSLIHI